MTSRRPGRKVAETIAEFVPDLEERRWIESALLIPARHRVGDRLRPALRGMADILRAPRCDGSGGHGLRGLPPGGCRASSTSSITSSTGVEACPIYVVTLARPDLVERRPDWGLGKRAFNSLYLEPLDAPAMRELLAGPRPGPAGHRRPSDRRRAPMASRLYAVETVRMLLADGRLTIDDGAYRPVGDLASLAVPATLTALIASRLDALEPDDRGAGLRCRRPRPELHHRRSGRRLRS